MVAFATQQVEQHFMTLLCLTSEGRYNMDPSSTHNKRHQSQADDKSSAAPSGFIISK